MPFKSAGEVTPAEIQLAVNVETEKQKDLYKMLAWIEYNCAALVGVSINDPKRFPSLEEIFSTLFEQKEQQDWRVIKERVEKYS